MKKKILKLHFHLPTRTAAVILRASFILYTSSFLGPGQPAVQYSLQRSKERNSTFKYSTVQDITVQYMILQYSTGHYRCTDVQMNSISVIVKEGEGVGDGRGVYGCPGRKVGRRSSK